MKTISCWDDLSRDGILPLTGEACGLSYRILCDATARGKRLLEKALSVVEIRLHENWNHGTDSDPHVGSIMLGPELLSVLGVFALLEDGWTKHWEIAQRNSSPKDGSGIQSDPDLTAARAYAFAEEPQKAFQRATEFELQKCSNRRRSDVAYPMAITYAHIAFAEARLHRRDRQQTATFEKAYVAACSHLASFKYAQDSFAISARSVLALTDAAMGACDRAWIGALNLAEPKRRAEALSDILCRRLELSQWQEAHESVRHLPPEIHLPPLTCWCAAAEIFASSQLYRDRKLAVMQYPQQSEQALAYAGIALGLKLRQTAKHLPAAVPMISVEPPAEEPGKAEATLKQAQTLADQGHLLAATSLLAEAEDLSTLERLSEQYHQTTSPLDQLDFDRLAVHTDTHLAILAGWRGDAEGFRQKAQAVSGYVRAKPNTFTPAVFLLLVEPAARLRNFQVAQEYLRQGRGSVAHWGGVAATLAVEMIRHGQPDAAQNLMKEMRYPRALFRVQTALAQSQSKANREGLWRRFQVIEELRNNVEKAAAYAGTAMALTDK